MDNGLIISGPLYDKLKLVVQILLPAISALYVGLSSIWGFSHVEQVVGTISVLTVFLGALIGVSSKNYKASDDKYDGEVVYSQDENGQVKLTKVLAASDTYEDVAAKDSLLLKVRPELVE